MKHSYTVLLGIMLTVIAISVFFPHSQFVEGLDMDDLEKGVNKVKENDDLLKQTQDQENEEDDDVDQEEDDGGDLGDRVGEMPGADNVQQQATYNTEDDCPDTVCLWKNKQKDNMDLVKAGNTVEDHDTTETFANWNPSW